MIERPVQDIKMELPRKLGFLMHRHPYKIAYGGRNSLKCLAVGTKVIMANGSLRAVEDVREGEDVMGPDSLPRRVLSTTRGESNMFRVDQTSAMSYVVNEAHILSLKRSASSKLPAGKLDPSRPVRYGRDEHTSNFRYPNGRYSGWPDVTNISIRDYMVQPDRWKQHFRGYRAGVIQYPERDVAVDPYFLGLWLGDGTGRELNITSIDPEVIDYCREFAAKNDRVISLSGKQRTEAKTIRFPRTGECVGRGSGRTNPIWAGFKSYDLPDNKHIPEDYQINSADVRLRLLAGLIDTDGTRHGESGYAISQVNERLARDIKRLADGLGFRTSLKPLATSCRHNGQLVIGRTWWVMIYGHAWRVPCLIARKRIDPNTPEPKKEYLQSKLTVTPVGHGEFAGFELDGDHLFLLEDGTVTHNSWSFARALLTLGIHQSLRILCGREIQKSLADSVHQLLLDQIEALGYGHVYTITDDRIDCKLNGTSFRFMGLSDITVDNTKGVEGIDILWAEEAEGITKRSLQVVLPVLFRTPHAECWVSFNPRVEGDEVWQRFIMHPPDGAVVVEMNWRDAHAAGWFQPEQDRLRQYDLLHSPDDYDNIWEGKLRSSIAGAIYSREVNDMVTDARFRPMPYDPRLPVHRIWDLGWNDLMTVIMVQKPVPSALTVINYIEDSRVTYPEMLATMDGLRYRWGTDWLPHDATQHHPTSGTNARKQLQALGCRVADIPRSDPEARIKAGRMMFPRVYLDDTKRTTPSDRPDRVIGGWWLMERLKQYKRHVPRTGASAGEPGGPVHDSSSHGADAFGGLAEIVDRIRNPSDDGAAVVLPAFRNAQSGMGMLG